jgi:ankyrin repeat protein/beta-lactamase regulating signal transducer with metallopeptidase domain
MIDVAVKATLILAIGLGVLRFSRGLTASLRHRLAAATFGVILLLPLAAITIPKQVVQVPERAARAIEMPRAIAAPAATADVAPAAAAQPAKRNVDFVSIAIWTYVAGAAFFLFSLLGGIGRLHRLRETADVSVAGTRLANDMAAAEGMRRGIEVVTTPSLAVPMTFGVSRPTILLPAETADWDDDSLRRAIRHELEHIVRGDWMTQVFSRAACALYWPHPMVWSLWRRLRLEAERACDDAVIRGGVAADSYAEQLVSLARRLVGRGSVPALAMATRSNLGQRVEAILDGGLRRGRASRFASATVIVTATAFLLALAPIEVSGGTSDPEDSDDRVYVSELAADPLDVALMRVAATGDVPAMRSLLNRGANANVMVRGDGSPLMFAAAKGQLDAMELLINSGADVNRGISGDGNPLIVAAQNGQLDAVRLLLDRGADIDLGIPGDGNALIKAAGAGHVEVVRFLLDRRANIEKEVPGDENPLIHASEGGSADVVRLLLERGANVNARVWAEFGDGLRVRGEWRTALKMAKRNGHKEVIEILVAAGARE